MKNLHPLFRLRIFSWAGFSGSSDFWLTADSTADCWLLTVTGLWSLAVQVHILNIEVAAVIFVCTFSCEDGNYEERWVEEDKKSTKLLRMPRQNGMVLYTYLRTWSTSTMTIHDIQDKNKFQIQMQDNKLQNRIHEDDV